MAKKSVETHSWCCCCSPLFWGWFLVIVGGYYLATYFGLISRDIPFWPFILLIFGIYILVNKYQKKTC